MIVDLLRKFKKPVLAGLDISSASVKLLVLSKSLRGYVVENFDVEPLPPEAMNEKEIKDPVIVGEAIRKIKDRSPIYFQHAAVAVADASVITKVIQMDKRLSENEMEAQILYEAERHIPYPIEEVRIDFQIIGDSQEAGQVDVMIAASRTETVDQYINAISAGGLQLRVVDIESHALQRACQLEIDRLTNKNSGDLVAIFDIGTNRSVLTMVRDQRTLFTRSDAFGGHILIRYIMDAYQKTRTEVETWMKQADWHTQIDPEIFEMFTRDIIETIRRELQYFSSATHYDEIQFIMLAGGAANTSHIVERIQESIQKPTSVANPFRQMHFSKYVNSSKLIQSAPAFLQTCGLALRSFDA